MYCMREAFEISCSLAMEGEGEGESIFKGRGEMKCESIKDTIIGEVELGRERKELGDDKFY
jgi:hypothetical protein